MGNTPKQERLFSLVPLGDFKALFGIDDQEDALAWYFLITITYTEAKIMPVTFFGQISFKILPL
jgi:hypothetical protein